MPAPSSLSTQSLILPNGLRVVLSHAPRLKRSAAALRVSAGSHDVPGEWPGLAHFLEHLFFLGTERFPAGQNLMAFAQSHGGQVNASTRDRTTDFFFELPQPAFAEGLERLCDMLAHPRMAFDEQLREREVLHAEFIAWSRDEAARDQMKLLEPVSVKHPLRWFHAGNRYSLLVPRPNFQQALQDFYQRFYQAGQMTLSLAGPQSLAELKALAERFGGLFAKGEQVESIAPPLLLDEAPNMRISSDSRRMHLIFACEDLPESAEEAVGFLCFWVANSQAGGLVAQLKAQGLAESLKAEMLYQFQGQVLLSVEIALSEAIASKLPLTDEAQSTIGVRWPATGPAHAQIKALLSNWLGFFKTHYPALRNEYALLQQKRVDVGGALMLARHYSEGRSCDRSPGLSDQGANALDSLIDQLCPKGQTSTPTDHQPNAPWRLPQPNAFLQIAQPPTTTCPPIPPFTFSDAVPISIGEGAVYLRWTLPSPQPALWKMLSDSLKPLIEDAQQAGVGLAFTAYGNHWQLKAAGSMQPLPSVLVEALKRLSNPDHRTIVRLGQPSTEPRLIPVRQLLKVLPDRLLQASNTNPDAQASLQSVWETALWSGMALGFSAKTQNALRHALSGTPGRPGSHHAPKPAAVGKGKRWETELSESSENAVLIFCATPTSSIKDQASWRLLAHLAQMPFYQRLRVELQLGYAVFSGFRQIAGQSGLLFGVQSPSATAAELACHIEQFIAAMPSMIASTDLDLQRNTLASQFDLNGLELENAAELLWQAHLNGHDDSALDDVKHYLSNLHESDLLAAVDQLTRRANGWLYLSNRSSPQDF